MSDLASIREIAHSLTHPNSRPWDAATLILVDRSGKEPKVLLGRRHPAHVFMPGHFVFPGGRIEAADRDAPAAADLHPSVEARLTRAVAARSPARMRARSRSPRYAKPSRKQALLSGGSTLAGRPAGVVLGRIFSPPAFFRIYRDCASLLERSRRHAPDAGLTPASLPSMQARLPIRFPASSIRRRS
jgi:hypothetical protein